MSLVAGEIVADRFVVEGPLGSGGMGMVFLARDRVEGIRVAVKVLHLGTADARERFRREASLLSALSHPGIVRYVAQGETEARRPFLAMELLEGEDLSARLARGALTVDESLLLGRRVAEALAFAHAQGAVHRDIKPSNLFLVGGEIERVKVLDFGIARAALQKGALTQTGAVLGTVGYMAPEQAMGARDVDGRADVFALGCVLFECLTGRPVFAGLHVIAVLAKVLSDEAPRLAELRPELAGPLDALLARMLAKERGDRPADLQRLAEELEALRRGVPTGLAPPDPASVRTLGHAEQRLVSVILAQPTERAEHAATRTPEEHGAETSGLEDLVHDTGVEFLPLEGGALVLIVAGTGAASDQAMRAASTALRLARLSPNLRVALATGRAEVTGGRPLGPAIDRAAALLQVTGAEAAGSAEGAGSVDGGVYLDEVTRGLLAARFVVRRAGGREVLLAEEQEIEAPRLLLGKRTPTVGRERELTTLEAMLTECVEEEVARAALVTAPPGTGKSRLGAELVERVRARGQARVLFVRAESGSAGSALTLARRLLASALGLSGKEAGAARAGLVAYVAEHFAADRRAVLRDFLGELLGLPAEEPPSPLLRAARSDGAVMQEQKRRAFEAFMDAQTAHGPWLVVLEDLHWGDTPTVRYLEDALACHAERPWMLLGLARPDVHETWPRLWAAAGVQEVRLSGLTRKAAERLARAVLGEAAEASLVSSVVDRAEGNAFYLEELLRRVAEGDTTLPETVLAMAQSRLERLEPEARRLLRAASVYGESCWPGALGPLLGPELDVAGWLETLVDREVLVRAQPSRFAGEREYRFRHALLREAAYAMMRDAERPTAHAQAGRWLEEAREQDALVLAEHFERGGLPDRAAEWLLRGSERAFDGGDAPGTNRLVERGLGLRAAGGLRGRLLAIGALASVNAGTLDPSRVREALTLLPPGSTPWWSALGVAIYATGNAGDRAVAELGQLALTTSPGDELTGPYGQALCGLAAGLSMLGQAATATAVLAPFDGLEPEDPRCEPTFVAWLDGARSLTWSYWSGSGPWHIDRGLRAAERSGAIMDLCGQAGGAAFSWFFACSAATLAGRYEEARQAGERAIWYAERTGNVMVGGWASLWLGQALSRAGAPQEALARCRSAHSKDPGRLRWRRVLEAEILLSLGETRQALQTVLEDPSTAGLGSVVACRAHLALDQPEECLRAARGIQHFDPAAVIDVHTSRAIALRALGREAEAREALASARDLLRTIAAGIEDQDVRRSWLEVDGCARTRALVRQWLSEDV